MNDHEEDAATDLLSHDPVKGTRPPEAVEYEPNRVGAEMNPDHELDEAEHNRGEN